MLAVLLIVVAVPEVMSKAPFNFRGSCLVSHLANTFSAKCNGSSKLIPSKELVLDNRVTASMTELELFNFDNITLGSGIQVENIKIKNTKHVSLYVCNMKLKELVIESVEVLTLRHHDQLRLEQGGVARVTLLNIKRLYLVNEDSGQFLLSASSVKISSVDDFGLESVKVRLTCSNLTIADTNMRFRGQSSLAIEGTLSNISRTVIYIHDSGYLSIKLNYLSVLDSKIDLEDGKLQLLNSFEVIFAGNSLYGFNNQSFSLFGHSDVTFLNNDIFTDDIVDMMSLKSKGLTFKDNHFGCSDCREKSKMLRGELGGIGDVNYCYADCRLSLNEYKRLLTNLCVCGDTDITGNLSYFLCAPCVTKNEHTLSGTLTNIDIFQYTPIFCSIMFILFVIVACSIYCRQKSCRKKSKCSKSLTCDESGSKVAIYRKPSEDSDHDDDDDNVGKFVILF